MCVSEVCGLKDVRVISPGAVRVGEPIKLECQFDTEGDQLYAVKWYRGNKEFYRFMPKETPQSKVYNSSGIKVNVSTWRKIYTYVHKTLSKYAIEVNKKGSYLFSFSGIFLLLHRCSVTVLYLLFLFAVCFLVLKAFSWDV